MYVALCWLYLARFWWQDGRRGDLCEKRLGAATCWPQPAPASSPVDPPQDTAEPMSGVRGASLETYSGEGKKHWTGRGGGEKKSEKQ